jgi:hypothetical protein
MENEKPNHHQHVHFNIDPVTFDKLRAGEITLADIKAGEITSYVIQKGSIRIDGEN